VPFFNIILFNLTWHYRIVHVLW